MKKCLVCMRVTRNPPPPAPNTWASIASSPRIKKRRHLWNEQVNSRPHAGPLHINFTLHFFQPFANQLVLIAQINIYNTNVSDSMLKDLKKKINFQIIKCDKTIQQILQNKPQISYKKQSTGKDWLRH